MVDQAAQCCYTDKDLSGHHFVTPDVNPHIQGGLPHSFQKCCTIPTPLIKTLPAKPSIAIANFGSEAVAIENFAA